ncbi:universal stress protein [Pseudonocardia sp. KRD-184]|uniref:Universal stress protein n=1 Tax=Pseudonocardia oceani TaxID=2792013 RepID=A0ABS6UDA5_9PSEU|nr:universal stress protein [Pseudonocardia oceani]MBW0089678.1 universal stress protein [Pseudonocardia oceani]MBW0095142.1 universal stress protein [Pseudonocardia oceani]MBW0107548.1 universal stress protein [Pseudonocardia oceani]MBW0120617.1 universal stress protein [Pseudonocardia oceani]MBW0129866.1 universal stress protein [Pseudonocardia oceani]
MNADRAPVVVGVGGAGTSDAAVEWASAEAAARGCPLLLVHAFHPPLCADPCGVLPPVDALVAAREEAEEVLAHAVARARAVASDGQVSTALLLGAPARALLDAARGASLLVLGRPAANGLRGLLGRSVAVRVPVQAPCPVVVIGAPRTDDGPCPPRVVVGVGAAESSAAVGFGFRAARQRGVPLVVVHAWTPDPPADLEGVAAPPSTAEARARRTLACAIGCWEPAFPDVAVHGALVHGRPEHALVARSRGAALLVVGTSGRERLLGSALGPVGRATLHRGGCPVAIVRHDHPRTPWSPAAPGREHGGSGRRRTWPA